MHKHITETSETIPNRILLGMLGLMLLSGCVALNPGADPLVVRTEQTLTSASASFDMVLRVDQADRGWWRTNAPAFHQFCEWMRTPTLYRGQTPVPRCVAMQLNVDDLKLAYKAAKTTGNSNALFTALGTLNAAVIQTTSWSNIVTAPIH